MIISIRVRLPMDGKWQRMKFFTSNWLTQCYFKSSEIGLLFAAPEPISLISLWNCWLIVCIMIQHLSIASSDLCAQNMDHDFSHRARRCQLLLKRLLINICSFCNRKCEMHYKNRKHFLQYKLTNSKLLITPLKFGKYHRYIKQRFSLFSAENFHQ